MSAHVHAHGQVSVEDNLLGAELLWTPEDSNDVMDRDDLFLNFPELMLASLRSILCSFMPFWLPTLLTPAGDRGTSATPVIG